MMKVEVMESTVVTVLNFLDNLKLKEVKSYHREAVDDMRDVLQRWLRMPDHFKYVHKDGSYERQ